MAKRDRTRAALDQLTEALVDPHEAEARAAIAKALRDRSSLVVAAALQAITEHELPGFEVAIVTAFERAMTRPVKADPGCRVKLAAVEALDVLREPADDVFMVAVRHVQPEPVWGGTEDSAGGLRGTAAMALVRRHHPEAFVELARLLADPVREARRIAAVAIAASRNGETGIPLLTLRIRAGEPDGEVVAACFEALLDLDAPRTVDFVTEHLHARDPVVVESAALALGHARPAGALVALRELADRALGETRSVALLAIAMLRSDAARADLLARIVDHPGPVAEAAIAAMSIYRDDPEVAEQVGEAIAGRPDQGRLRSVLRDQFGDP